MLSKDYSLGVLNSYTYIRLLGAVQKRSDGHPKAKMKVMNMGVVVAQSLGVKAYGGTYMIDESEVINTVAYCLYDNKELENYEEGTAPPDTVIVKGITTIFGFQPQRLEEQREQVKDWLESLPDQFRASGGGGWSFLNMCEDRDGNQWADTHKGMEGLMCLGIGLGMVEYCVSREHWDSLYGGMPYIIIFPKEKAKGN